MAISLPVETLIAIFEEVDDVQDLRHLRMASRALCAITTPLAFSALSVITTSSSAQNLGRLFDLPDIVAHVKEVSYHDTGADRSGKALECVSTDAIKELVSSFSRIHQLPRLEAINLKFNPAYIPLNSDRVGRLSLQVTILGALAASFSVRAPSKLVSLSLLNLRALDPHPLEILPLQTILTTLQRLQLSAVYDDYPDPFTFFDRWHDFWGSLWLRMIPVQTQIDLTNLTLHSDVPVGTDSGELILSELHFPRLSVLSLRDIVFSTPLGAEDFILRHAATLTQLELLKCKVLNSHNRLLSLLSLSGFPNPATDEELRHWDRIWDRFAAELTGLVTLSVDERHNNYREYRYVYRRIGGSYSLIHTADSESRDAADLAALQRFRVTVAARSAQTRVES